MRRQGWCTGHGLRLTTGGGLWPRRAGVAVLCLAFCAAAAGARAERIRIYDQENYHGAAKIFFAAQQNLASEGENRTAASAKVITGRWLLCERPFYAGDCAWISRDVPSFREISFAGAVSSLRPEHVPVLRREWGGRRPPSRSALVFFSQKDFQGDWIALRDSVPDLAQAQIEIKPASIVLQSGAWRVCTQPEFAGSCLSMTASAWNLGEIFTTEIRSAEHLQ